MKGQDSSAMLTPEGKALLNSNFPAIGIEDISIADKETPLGLKQNRRYPINL